jgi:hypothetical protein
MHKDINKLVRFGRDDAHSTGLPKHQRGTSSKVRLEAMGGEGMIDGRMKGQR